MYGNSNESRPYVETRPKYSECERVASNLKVWLVVGACRPPVLGLPVYLSMVTFYVRFGCDRHYDILNEKIKRYSLLEKLCELRPTSDCNNSPEY